MIDIALFIVKNDLSLEETQKYEFLARKRVRDLIYKYKVGFDILSAPFDYPKSREADENLAISTIRYTND